ncbi:MAG: hypothetical protein BAJALOKI3v1_190048 [Promethearchaeota archaeon]|nr:MAG: hypothetical protein BAJALOKI3v1_190048 [Candidatus Lokiarchaeota archaeon]
MVDWNNYQFDWFAVYWNEFVNWFMIQPLYAQILVIAGIFAILSLTLVLAYYIIKGLVYLVYYIFKGTYYLLKYIGVGIYKLFKALYYAISGKEDPSKISIQYNTVNGSSQSYPKKEIKPVFCFKEPDKVKFCSECGSEFSEKAFDLLSSRGSVYCENCGTKYNSSPIEGIS